MPLAGCELEQSTGILDEDINTNLIKQEELLTEELLTSRQKNMQNISEFSKNNELDKFKKTGYFLGK